jgi:ACR3 family arsenite efflux pump ArsB
MLHSVAPEARQHCLHAVSKRFSFSLFFYAQGPHLFLKLNKQFEGRFFHFVKKIFLYLFLFDHHKLTE